MTQRDARFVPDPEKIDPGRYSHLMEARIILAATVRRFSVPLTAAGAASPVL